MQLAPSLHRIGTDSVACYLVEDAGEITVVDAGLPGFYGDLLTELDAMGRSLDDIRAVVLTHGHSDHIGFAERLRAEQDVPVSVHELDVALAKGEVPNPSAGLKERRLTSLTRFLLWSASKGGLRIKNLTDVSPLPDATTLDVPGAPTIVHAPGHTPGCVVLHVPSLDALLVGDALSTVAVTSGREGPQIPPFSADPDQALESLSGFEAIEAAWVLPGHGAPWTGGVAAAVEAARSTGVDHLARP